MTSSLVGSEMCIRDRMMCSGSWIPTRLPGRLLSRILSSWPQQGHINTVSYTHLTLPTICSV
eukprot:4319296-Prorocentrum_lima.AAC.1